ncbi:MAG TPA: hypothetical protein VEY33_01560 [Gemmatimonadota bacterium]|nr:hypothetical protein [Gemmatimonadota bacterium]
MRRQASILLVIGLIGLALARPSGAQNAPPAVGDGSATLREYLRLVDGVLAIQVALGQTSGPEADARLQAAGRDFVARGAPAAELGVMRSQLEVAAGGLFADLDRDIANARSFPGPLPVEVSRALARRLLGSARSKLTEALVEGDDPLPILAQASKVLARVRGFTDLPRELDRFADAAERAERIAAMLPPPGAAGPVGNAPPPPSVGPLAQGPTGPPGPMAQGSPTGPPGPMAQGSPTGPPGPMAQVRPPAQGGPPPVAAPSGPGPAPSPTYPLSPSPSPGPMGPPRAPAPAPGSAVHPSNPTTPARAPAPGPAPARGPSPAPVIASDPILAVLGVGTMEAEARLEGPTWNDVVGRTWPPANDGEPDTGILLKLAAPGLVLDWIEVRSAPDPTEAIWTTNGTPGTLPIGLAHRDRFLNDAKGSVSGLQIEDFVVLSLYVQDDGLLERLEQPGTITVTYRGGDVATIPIEPLW